MAATLPSPPLPSAAAAAGDRPAPAERHRLIPDPPRQLPQQVPAGPGTAVPALAPGPRLQPLRSEQRIPAAGERCSRLGDAGQVTSLSPLLCHFSRESPGVGTGESSAPCAADVAEVTRAAQCHLQCHLLAPLPSSSISSFSSSSSPRPRCQALSLFSPTATTATSRPPISRLQCPLLGPTALVSTATQCPHPTLSLSPVPPCPQHHLLSLHHLPVHTVTSCPHIITHLSSVPNCPQSHLTSPQSPPVSTTASSPSSVPHCPQCHHVLRATSCPHTMSPSPQSCHVPTL